MKQTDLDHEMQSAGVHRYRTRINKARIRGHETFSGAGYRVLEESTGIMAKAITRWKVDASTAPGRMHRVYPLLKGLKDSVISLIACKAILDGISVSRTITGLANHVGSMVEDEAKIKWLKTNHPEVWHKAMYRMSRQPSERKKVKHLKTRARDKDIELPAWPIPERIAVGFVLIELFKQNTGIIEMANRTNKAGREMVIVRATDEFMDWMRKSHACSEVLKPVYMPMIQEPCKWDNPYEGGYFAGIMCGNRPLVKSHNRQYMKTLEHRDMSLVYDAVNQIQSVEWAINPKVLETVRHCFENNLLVGGIPDRNGTPIPPRPDPATEDEEAKRQWKKRAAFTHHKNDADRTTLYAVARSLKLAEKFLGQSIWFPQELDFRGRIYPKPIYLNNQGADWQRSLLTFAKGKPVDDNAYSWLAVHGANCAGIDKVSFADRLHWVTENNAWIVKCGQDPISNLEWTTTDKPFSFLAFAVEWAALAADRNHLCSLPCHLDGSNNGLQLFSLMMRDEVGALATNCLPTEQPNDIYQLVADKAVEKLKHMSDPLAQWWIDFGLNRKTTKRVVMCLPYGLTKYSAKAYIRDWYMEECAQRRVNFGYDVFQHISLLTGVVWEAIDEVASSATRCMDWLRKCSDVHIENDMPIRWSTPSGFLVEQAYRKTEKVVVKTSIGKTIRQHVAVVDRPELSPKRNRNGISPNFVHSMDASLLMSVVLTLRNSGVNSVSCIHDSIGVCPADVGTLSTAIRECAVGMFSEPILEQAHKEMISYLPTGIDLPEPPSCGMMDINQLAHADYFFA